MPGMDQFLAAHYGNLPIAEPTDEDRQKIAQAEMFLKLASANGVGINSLSNDQVQELWSKVSPLLEQSSADEQCRRIAGAPDRPLHCHWARAASRHLAKLAATLG